MSWDGCWRTGSFFVQNTRIRLSSIQSFLFIFPVQFTYHSLHQLTTLPSPSTTPPNQFLISSHTPSPQTIPSIKKSNTTSFLFLHNETISIMGLPSSHVYQVLPSRVTNLNDLNYPAETSKHSSSHVLYNSQRCRRHAVLTFQVGEHSVNK